MLFKRKTNRSARILSPANGSRGIVDFSSGSSSRERANYLPENERLYETNTHTTRMNNIAASTRQSRICRTFKNKLASPKQTSAMASVSATITTATSTTSTLENSIIEKTTLEDQSEIVDETVTPCTVVIRVYTSDAPGASPSTTLSASDDNDNDKKNVVKEKEETIQKGETNVTNLKHQQTQENIGKTEYSNDDDDGDHDDDDDDSLFNFDELLAAIAQEEENDDDATNIPVRNVNVVQYAFSGENKAEVGLRRDGSLSTMEETWYSNTEETWYSKSSSLSTMEETGYSKSYSYGDEGSVFWGNDMCQKVGVQEIENTADAALYQLTEKVSSYLEKNYPKSQQRLLAAWREHSVDLDPLTIIKSEWFMGRPSSAKRRQAQRHYACRDTFG